uniref:Uncharacterized protein LOC103961440 n=1 Tax=Rhizophora mucronata TaxID=61149 RepID=A0A2P2Q7U1_RHIMU
MMLMMSLVGALLLKQRQEWINTKPFIYDAVRSETQFIRLVLTGKGLFVCFSGNSERNKRDAGWFSQ